MGDGDGDNVGKGDGLGAGLRDGIGEGDGVGVPCGDALALISPLTTDERPVIATNKTLTINVKRLIVTRPLKFLLFISNPPCMCQ